MKKKEKLIKKILIIGVIIIAVELLGMLIIKILRERDIDHLDMLNDIIEVDNGYIAVGVSDFNNSSFVDKKIYKYTNSETKNSQNIIANQSKIAMYDKEFNLVWENTYKNMYDSTFYSVLKVDDGYIAVGSLISKMAQIDNDTRDALIVKFDFNGKEIWSKTYHVLSDTEFYKIIDDGDDNVVVVGQSIYENMEMGSHITGGGIIVRYDKDGNVLAHNNYGGNKSGSFNDIIKTDDGYIVCGKDATNYGIVVKFMKDFDRDDKDTNLITKKVIWQRSFANTDTIGFTSMIIKGDTIYAVGAINTSNEKTEEDKPIYKYDAGIALYNTKGKYLGKYTILEEVHHRFNSVILDNDELILTGLLDVDNRKKEKQESFTMKFNTKDNKFIDKKVFDNSGDYIVNKIVSLDRKIIVGASKSNNGIYGCEYEPIIQEYK